MKELFELLFNMSVTDITVPFIIAQIIGVFTTAISVISAQLKKIPQILICMVLSNLSVACTYLLLGEYSGSYICFIAIFQSLISFFYTNKEKTMPYWQTGIFMALYTAVSLITFSSYKDILSLMCALLYALAIVQKSTLNYRIIMILNSVLWLIYSYLASGYTTMITYFLLIVSLLIGLFRQDLKKKSAKQ